MNQKSDKQIKIELMIEALKVLNQPEDKRERETLRRELETDLRFY